MKKKFTRKVRKNKRTTQRRKNRSYKRMRGGMYDFKTRGFFSREKFPDEVIKIISSSELSKIINDETKSWDVEEFLERYKTLINDTNLETTIHETQKWRSKNERAEIIKEIQTAIKEFTSKTDEEPLASLPVSTTPLGLIIGNLKENKFLPTAKEIIELIRSFKLQGDKDKEYKKGHITPFKFNGLALAIAIMKISDFYKINRPTQSLSPPPSSPSPPLSPSSPDTTNKPQKYIFVFDPRQVTSWEDLKTSIPPNSICHQRQRIRMCASDYGGPHPFGEQPTDRSLATYNKFHIVDGEPLAPEVIHKIHTGDELIRRQSDLSEYDKTIIFDNRLRGGEYKFYRIVKHRQNIDYTNIRNRTVCRNKIFIPVDIKTVYEYGEDGIINSVYILFKHGDVVRGDGVEQYCSADHTTPSNAVNNEVIVSMENILKLGLNPRVTDIHTIGEFEPLIDVKIEISRGTPSSLGVTADSPIRTLVMTSPGKWEIVPATRIQQAAFNRVNQYLINKQITSYDMLQIKRFRVSNNMEGPGEIMVIIEVKEMNPDGTLKRAFCMGETLSQFEVLDTHESASIRKFNKESNYSQIISSGPIGI